MHAKRSIAAGIPQSKAGWRMRHLQETPAAVGWGRLGPVPLAKAALLLVGWKSWTAELHTPSLTCQKRWRPPRSSAAAPVAHTPLTLLHPASRALASPRVLTQGKEASQQSQDTLLHAPAHSGQAVPRKGKDLGMQKVFLSLSWPWTPDSTFEVFQILLAQGHSESVQVGTTFCN